MALHFTRPEFEARIQRTVREMVSRGLDGMLLFQQESMYYLTGYDTFGFCFFQCLYLGADGRLALLTRSADFRQAQHTSIIDDIRIWTDAAGARPADQLKDVLISLGARRKLSRRDQLTLEWAGVYRHYHAAFMRTIIIGKPNRHHLAMEKAGREALAEVETCLRPGRTAGEVFDVHASVIDAHGMRAHRLNACGYSLGAKFTPSWMDSPMFYRGNPEVIAPGMVFFAHMILMDSDSSSAYCLGRTYIVGEERTEPVSRYPLEMITR